MSSIIINGREIELLEPDYPDFFEPKPLSPKTKSNILFADINGNIHIHFQEIHRKPLLKRRSNIIIGNIPSILGKRKLVDAFDQEIYKDKERYGQDISHDFFKDHVGHDVVLILMATRVIVRIPSMFGTLMPLLMIMMAFMTAMAT